MEERTDGRTGGQMDGMGWVDEMDGMDGQMNAHMRINDKWMCDG